MLNTLTASNKAEAAPGAISIGKGKISRRAYGFDEVALVPGSTTADLELCDVRVTLGPHTLKIPFLASAMDSVVDVRIAGLMGKFGGLGVFNLQGLQTRYDDPLSAYNEVITCDNDSFVEVMQKLYS